MNKWEKEVQESLLKDEQAVIKALKQCYASSLEDCNNKIADFMLRIQTGDNVQSAIYQKQYQEALKGQIEAALQKLQTDNFTTIQDYLNGCYENGFMGAFYDIQNQGIPLIMPIDQEQMIKAITTNSKISEGLYKRLGIDAKQLKKVITGQVSRGISTGTGWEEIARNIRNNSGTNFNNAVRIARTEGHRIQQESALDACVKAKSKGADVVKQWDATMDSSTRESHAKLDGQIRELDEAFEVDGKKADSPGHFGDPSEDCNCRCCLLQRARWALDESELKTLQERASYFGLDKTKNFEDYKNKYLDVIKENSIIIDERTPCLRRLSDNKIVETSVVQISPTKKEYKDWEFDWTIPEAKGYKVYGVKANGDDRIQGLIALKPDYKDYQAMIVDIVESAPFNNPHNKLFTGKEYSGVGGHLFAEAAKQSYENGLDGYVFFKAKSNLIEHYQNELGAILINPSERTMVIDERGAKILYDRYYKGK